MPAAGQPIPCHIEVNLCHSGHPTQHAALAPMQACFAEPLAAACRIVEQQVTVKIINIVYLFVLLLSGRI